ncbi:NAD(P)H-dependent oxidoreductase [Nonomuraea sp. NN258]|uniref:NADPH-dependent FMN reductase n=1 Tax=Nonomuraea antri TaxID=2730852 RepID=UPI001569A2A1|nr:NAD(P)H-dependent oxidoreductase [Nonomuraea antri]NRQ36177.1 NAD(P)H-dependent oxidoreductase [Nonomuraea antri]
MIKIGIIIGSTRPSRVADGVAQWVHDLAAKRSDAHFELLDLAAFDLPLLNEPLPAATGQYAHAHSRTWAETITRFDGFVFVTPEYNHSTTGTLKNAIDYLFHEWADKAAGLVSYGVDGGVRAAEHLRQILGQLHMATVTSQVALSLHTDFTDYTRFTPAERQELAVTAMLDKLIAWSTALRPLRAA